MKNTLPNSNNNMTNGTVQNRTPNLKILKLCPGNLKIYGATKTNKIGNQNMVCG